MFLFSCIICPSGCRFIIAIRNIVSKECFYLSVNLLLKNLNLWRIHLCNELLNLGICHIFWCFPFDCKFRGIKIDGPCLCVNTECNVAVIVFCRESSCINPIRLYTDSIQNVQHCITVAVKSGFPSLTSVY